MMVVRRSRSTRCGGLRTVGPRGRRATRTCPGVRPATSATVTGLTPGTSYVFQVAARNAVGWAGVWSASSAPREHAVDGAVRADECVRRGGQRHGGVDVVCAQRHGGSAITGYGVDYSSDGGATWTTALAPSAGMTATSYTVTGLTNGTAYVFRVAAANAIGHGSLVGHQPCLHPARDGAWSATGVVGSNATSTSIDVSWTRSVDGGSPIMQYAVRRSSDGGATWAPGYTYVSGSPARRR